MESIKFWHLPIDYCLKELNSSETGLTEFQALGKLEKRRLTVGKQVKVPRDIRLFFSQFKNPFFVLLILASLISGALGQYSDLWIILGILFLSVILGFFQERKANRVLQKLKGLISLKSLVVRDDVPKEISSEDIVEGDIIILNAGDLIPADGLILESNELHLNESILTGESLPVRKREGVVDENTILSKRFNAVWKGTNVVSGEGKVLVINTGIQTIFGKLDTGEGKYTESGFEKGLKEFGFLLMKITLILAFIILFVNLLVERNWLESFLFALALAVGMAPELLPAINIISMSAGAKRLLTRKVLVKKLNSVQNLGEVNLLCTDKTGTLTEGIIQLSKITNPLGEESEWVKKLAFLNASLQSGYSNPMDDALKEIHPKLDQEVIKMGEIPFDFNRKRLSIFLKEGKRGYLVTKGAFKEIFKICSYASLDGKNQVPISNLAAQIENQFKFFGENGIRAIGVCYKDLDKEKLSLGDETNMVFAGFILMEDPVKTDIIDTILKLNQLNVQLKIITGDNINVARKIATQIGFSQPKLISGLEISNMSSADLSIHAKEIDVFAETDPQQKEKIIQALKRNFSVAYMGDGINDVSALQVADIGISVENAVDVAKEASDIILMEKDLSVLEQGIREGRKTFANTMKYLFISTGATFGNMCSVAIASFLIPFLPMLPKQILLTNFLTDFPFLAVSTDQVDEEQYQRPRKWDISLIKKYMVVFGMHSTFFDIITFSYLFFVIRAAESEFQTGWFVVSVLSEIFIVFVIRTQKHFFKSKPGKLLLWLSMMAILFTVSIPFIPIFEQIGLVEMPIHRILILLTIVVFYVLTADFLKIWFFKKYSEKNSSILSS